MYRESQPVYKFEALPASPPPPVAPPPMAFPPTPASLPSPLDGTDKNWYAAGAYYLDPALGTYADAQLGVTMKTGLDWTSLNCAWKVCLRACSLARLLGHWTALTYIPFIRRDSDAPRPVAVACPAPGLTSAHRPNQRRWPLLVRASKWPQASALTRCGLLATTIARRAASTRSTVRRAKAAPSTPAVLSRPPPRA